MAWDHEREREERQATPSEHLPQKWAPRIEFNADHARKLIARFVSIYGDWRVADASQRSLLVREYVEQLGAYSPPKVQQAASALIRTSKTWPTPSEIVEVIRAQIQVSHVDRHWCAEESKQCDIPYRQCCGAPPTPQEIEKRKEFMLRMRQACPSVFDKGEAKPEIKEPEIYDIKQSDITPELKALIAKRAAKSRAA